MNKLIVFVCLLGAALAGQKSYNGHKVFQLNVDNSVKFDVLKSIQFEVGVDFWDAFHSTDATTRVMVAPERLEFFKDFMATHQISYDVIFNNAET